jgi:hypothetical protein
MIAPRHPLLFRRKKDRRVVPSALEGIARSYDRSIATFKILRIGIATKLPEKPPTVLHPWNL